MLDSLKQVADTLNVNASSPWWSYAILFIAIVFTFFLIDPWLKHGKFL